MSECKDTGGLAFPQAIAVGPAGDIYRPGVEGDGGMSQRDWFAGQALTGLAGRLGYFPQSNPSEIARDAYALADAMLEERNK